MTSSAERGQMPPNPPMIPSISGLVSHALSQRGIGVVFAVEHGMSLHALAGYGTTSNRRRLLIR
jgi:hypothetical protein